jgi:hypothetical protein
MYFITSHINYLVSNVNKILEESNNRSRVYIAQENKKTETATEHTITYSKILYDTFEEVIIYQIKISVQDDTPQETKDGLLVYMEAELFSNILLRSRFQEDRLTIHPTDYWRMN